MKWCLYKKDDPNTWPKIDCPMVVYFPESDLLTIDVYWDNEDQYFADEYGILDFDFYYAYIGHVPCGYKTHKVLKCVDDIACKIGCNDDGYCMYDYYKCEQQREENEYEIEEKRIWKEFDE